MLEFVYRWMSTNRLLRPFSSVILNSRSAMKGFKDCALLVGALGIRRNHAYMQCELQFLCNEKHRNVLRIWWVAHMRF